MSFQQRAQSGKSNKNQNTVNNKLIEEELEHQIKKSKLLDDDRKNFYVNAEETKSKNNEIIDELKKENKELKKLRDELLANKRSTTGPAGMSKTVGAGFGGEVKDENYWRRKLDEQQHLTKNKKDILLNLQDKLNEVIDTKFGGNEESSLMRNIRILENRLDKVMIKFNEAQSIRKTYEQIVKRLKEERVGYDNQLAAIERSLKGKEHDFEELLLLAHDATHAKELAQAEHKKYEHKKAAVKELRTTYLKEKWAAINARNEVMSRIDKRDNQDKDQDKVNVPRKENNQIGQDQQVDQQLNNQKLKDFEEAFRRLYEATGEKDVNGIIQKYTTQSETAKSLHDLKSEYEESKEQKKNEIKSLKESLNDLKYEGGEALTRKQIDEIETNVNNAVNKCERTKNKYERSSKILVNAKAGIEHLVEKLDFYKLDGKPNVIVTDDTLIEALDQCVQKMQQVYEVVKNDEQYDEKNFQQTALGMAASSTQPFSMPLYDFNKEGVIRQKNNRINIPDKEDEDLSEGDMDDDIDIEVTTKLKQKYEIQAKQDKGAKQKNKKK